MATQPKSNPGSGITEKKQAELNTLSQKVLSAQQELEQCQAIVDSLTNKLNNFQSLLISDDENRVNTLNNKNLADQIAQSILDLRNNSEITFNKMISADSKTKSLTESVSDVLKRLIYSAEVINKLANIVFRKKAVNPLISDDLLSMVNKASADANNAVALELLAFKSTFSAQASNIESGAASTQEYFQAMDLYHLICGKDSGGNVENSNDTISASSGNSLIQLLENAYTDAVSKYEQTSLAVKLVTEQLNDATAHLHAATTELNSLQSGLTAANAAR